MGSISIIKQGESFDFEFDRGNDSISGWTCTIHLKKFPADNDIIKRVITPVNDKWTGFLTQDETKDLDVSHYTLIGKLTNSTTNQEEQDTRRFNVSKVWA